MKVLLGISGASGAVYGVRTGEALCYRGVELHLVVTATAWEILDQEIGTGKIPPPGTTRRSRLPGMGLPGRKRWLAGRVCAPPGGVHLPAGGGFTHPLP